MEKHQLFGKIQKMYFILFFLFYSIIICENDICTVSNDIKEIIDKYCDYNNYTTPFECNNNTIKIRDNFYILYESNLDYYYPENTYFIISNKFVEFCTENVIVVNINWISVLLLFENLIYKRYTQFIIYYDDLDDKHKIQINKVIDFLYGDIVYMNNEFKNSEFNTAINELSDLNHVVIIDLFYDENKSTLLLTEYQKIIGKKPKFISFFLDENYLHGNKNLVKNINVASGYFSTIPYEKNQEFLSILDIENDKYPNDLIYQMYIFFILEL